MRKTLKNEFASDNVGPMQLMVQDCWDKSDHGNNRTCLVRASSCSSIFALTVVVLNCASVSKLRLESEADNQLCIRMLFFSSRTRIIKKKGMLVKLFVVFLFSVNILMMYEFTVCLFKRPNT